jgi:lactate permease
VLPTETDAAAGSSLDSGAIAAVDGQALRKARMPWLILTATVFVWGIPAVKSALDGIFKLAVPIPGLDQAIVRMPPVVPVQEAEKAVFSLNLRSATGSSI